MKRFGIILPIVIALASCGSDPAPTVEGEGTVSGKVLEGSISDAMLPLDTIRSQSPRLVNAPSNAGGSSSEDTTTSETESDPRANASTDEPAAAPTAAEASPEE